MNRSLIALFATVLLAGTVYAESEEGNTSRRDHRGPPKAALEACSNLVKGDPCSFAGRRDDTVQGTCDAPEDKPLACAPEGGPPENRLERNQR